MAFIDSYSQLLFFLLILISICVNTKSDTSTQNQTTGYWTQSHNSFAEEFERIEINRYCDINDNCTHHTLCVDNQCRCRPNHRWNRVNHECESFDCMSNKTECQAYDPNRKCKRELPTLFLGKCECKHGYYEDRRSLKCRKYCFHNKECDPGLKGNRSSNNMVCVDFMCHCRPNTRWNVTTNRCDPFNCTKDAECWTGGDENRECFQGQCRCNFQEDMESTKCYLTLYSLFRVRNYKTRKERLLLFSIFIMPSVVLYCLYSQMKKKKLNKAIQKNIENSQIGLNYIYMTKTHEMKTTKI